MSKAPRSRQHRAHEATKIKDGSAPSVIKSNTKINSKYSLSNNMAPSPPSDPNSYAEINKLTNYSGPLPRPHNTHSRNTLHILQNDSQ